MCRNQSSPIHLLLAGLFLLLACSGTSNAQDSLNITLLGTAYNHWGAAIHGLAVHGNTAYAGISSHGLARINITDSELAQIDIRFPLSSPSILAESDRFLLIGNSLYEWENEELVERYQFSYTDHFYLRDTTYFSVYYEDRRWPGSPYADIVGIVDGYSIADPTNPVEIAHFEFGGGDVIIEPADFLLWDEWVFFCSVWDGLWVAQLDGGNPDAFPVEAGGSGLMVQGTDLYVLQEDQTSIYSLADDPANPQMVGNWPVSGGRWKEIGDTLLVEEYLEGASYTITQYNIADLENPEQIRQITGGLELGEWTYDNGNLLTSYRQTIYLYHEDNQGGFACVDSLSDAGFGPKCVSVSGDTAAVADGEHGIHFLNLASIGLPEELTTFQPGGTVLLAGILQDRLYGIRTENGVGHHEIYELNSLSEPDLVTTWEDYTIIHNKAHVWNQGDSLLVCEMSAETGSKYWIVDPFSENPLQHTGYDSNAYVVDWTAPNLYLRRSHNSPDIHWQIRQLSFEDPANPAITGEIEFGEFQNDVNPSAFVEGYRAWGTRYEDALGSTWLLTYDISTFSSPVLLNELEIPGNAQIMAEENGFLIVKSYNRLLIYDYVHYAGVPELVGYYDLPGSAEVAVVDIDHSRLLLTYGPALMVLESDALQGTSVDEGGSACPSEITLSQTWPNPFNSATGISYTLPRAQFVRISVHDLLGRQVTILDEGMRRRGTHRTIWQIGQGYDSVASGTYFIRFETDNSVLTRRAVLVK